MISSTQAASCDAVWMGMNDALRFSFYQMSAPFFIFYLILLQTGWKGEKETKRQGGGKTGQGEAVLCTWYIS